MNVVPTAAEADESLREAQRLWDALKATRTRADMRAAARNIATFGTASKVNYYAAIVVMEGERLLVRHGRAVRLETMRQLVAALEHGEPTTEPGDSATSIDNNAIA